MSVFITFEGIEGCGKTTQLRLLAESLKERGAPPVVTREPGGCPIADAIRAILLDPESSALVPRAELLLYAAARAQHVEEVIRPALDGGKTVLCDRYVDATLAYQGSGRGLDKELVSSLNDLAAGGLTPHLTLLLEMPSEKGLQRARRRNDDMALGHEDRFEQESMEFHRRVRLGYLELAALHPERFRIINADGSREDVAAEVRKTVFAFLDEQGSP